MCPWSRPPSTFAVLVLHVPYSYSVGAPWNSVHKPDCRLNYTIALIIPEHVCRIGVAILQTRLPIDGPCLLPPSPRPVFKKPFPITTDTPRV